MTRKRQSHYESKPIRHMSTGRVATCLVLSLGIALMTAPAVTLADTVEEAQEAVDEAEQGRDDVLTRIDDIERQMDETYEHIPVAKDALSNFIRASYKAQGGNIELNLLDSLLGCSTFDEVLSTMRAHEAWRELGTMTVDALMSRQSELNGQKAQLDSELEQAEMTLQEAHEELEARQEEAAEAERVAATAVSTAQSGSSAPTYEVTNDGATYTLSEFMFMGVIYQNGFRYTYYSESVLPGGGLSIPGRHHEDGFVCDGDGYICVASNDFAYGTVVPVPFAGRMGKVYDCGCASGTIDIYIA